MCADEPQYTNSDSSYPESTTGYQAPPATVVRSLDGTYIGALRDDLEDFEEKMTQQNSSRDRRILDLEAHVHGLPEELNRIIKHNNNTTSTKVVREFEAKMTAMIAEKLDVADAAIADTNSALHTKMKDMMDAIIADTVVPRTTERVLEYVQNEAMPQTKQELQADLTREKEILPLDSLASYVTQGAEASVHKLGVQLEASLEERLTAHLEAKIREQLETDMRAKFEALETEMKAELTTAFGTASRGSASDIRRKVEEDLRSALRLEIYMELQEKMEAKFNALESGMAARIRELEDRLALALAEAQADDVVVVERE
ncbi:MAG: hypothetical protein CMP47_00010 [Rickettsiales bacterium]|nr:hypothetical protein [Rickettsiales bacterium]